VILNTITLVEIAGSFYRFTSLGRRQLNWSVRFKYCAVYLSLTISNYKRYKLHLPEYVSFLSSSQCISKIKTVLVLGTIFVYRYYRMWYALTTSWSWNPEVLRTYFFSEKSDRMKATNCLLLWIVPANNWPRYELSRYEWSAMNGPQWIVPAINWPAMNFLAMNGRRFVTNIPFLFSMHYTYTRYSTIMPLWTVVTINYGNGLGLWDSYEMRLL